MSRAPLRLSTGSAAVPVLIALVVVLIVGMLVLFGTRFVHRTSQSRTTGTIATPAGGAVSMSKDGQPVSSAPSNATPDLTPSPPSSSPSHVYRIEGSVQGESGEVVVGASVVAMSLSTVGTLDADRVGQETVTLTPDRIAIPAARGESPDDEDEPVLARAETDADGSFLLQFHDASEGIEVLLRVNSPSYAAASRRAQLTSVATTRREDFVLARGLHVTGTVRVNPTGEPAEGMMVRVVEHSSGSWLTLAQAPVGEAPVAADGTFAIGGLPAGEFRVLPHSNGSDFVTPGGRFAKAVLLSADSPHAEAHFKVEVGGSVHGMVRDEHGTPLEGVAVGLMPGDALDAAVSGDLSRFALLDELRVESDSSGRYRLHGVPLRSPLRVTAHSSDHASPDPIPIALSTEERVREVDFDLSVGSTISGMVVDDRGTPLPGVRVGVLPDFQRLLAGGFNPTPKSFSASTNERGEFDLEHLSAGTYTLAASDSDTVFRSPLAPPTGGEEVTVDGVTDVSGVTLTYAEQSADGANGLLTGQVVDDQGEPIGAASIVGTTVGVAIPRVLTTASGSAGEFQIAGLGDGPVQLQVQHADYGARTVTGYRGDDRDVQIPLLRNGSVSGRVITSDGVPVSQFRVRAEPMLEGEADTLAARIQQITINRGRQHEMAGGEDGSFRLPSVPSGRVQIIARALGFAESRSAPLDLPPGGEITGVEVVLLAGATARGRVVTSDGRTLEGAAVRCRRVTDSAMEEMMEGFMPGFLGGSDGLVSDERGHYEIAHLAPGTYEVTAQHPEFAPSPPVTFTIVGEEEVHLDSLVLDNGGIISGRLVDPNGTGKAGLMVQLLSGSAPMQMARSDKSGRFEFKGARAGDYTLVVTDLAAMQRGDMQLKMRAVTLEPGGREDIEIAYGRGFTLRGRVTGFQPPSMQSITLLRPGAPSSADIDSFDVKGQVELSRHMEGIGFIKPDGAYEIRDIEAGTYILEIPRLPENPMDPNAYKGMDRTPRYREEVRISGDQTLDLAL